MKYKLKKDVMADKLPRFSGVHKIIASTLSSEKTVDVEVLPKGMDEFLEEVKSSKKKGDK